MGLAWRPEISKIYTDLDLGHCFSNSSSIVLELANGIPFLFESADTLGCKPVAKIGRRPGG